MHTGTLFFDKLDNRYAIRYKDEYGSQSYSFHCGDCLDIKLNDVWIPTRIEMDCSKENDGWYLVGIPGMPKTGTPICT
ncbi:DUF5348 domain-containing protein [Enterocloster bolteae]|jgi:hypothetical protein|uniref:DUF5348 domain-containing protein n=1 Tax=Enterocloster bolteae TaxID=208479 RepID=UPI00210B7326|nr:DUF5348 domain-containing protein [Enterocloster bolteae]MCQ4754654.1 DUF5348 domain-containing protein [Enterocloster bolteae]